MLPLLLHHANRTCKSPEFYAIKNKLLTDAEVVGYDIQHIEGKRCHSCNGTGWYKYLDRYRIWCSDPCWHCTQGWYKQPMWVFLAVKKLGAYRFHQPMHRRYGEVNPYHIPTGMKTGQIDGYVDHTRSRYGEHAVLLLFLLYDRAAAKKYFREMGWGWRLYWWYPSNWLKVVAHFYANGWDSYPIKRLREYLERVRVSYESGVHARNQVVGDDDLPF